MGILERNESDEEVIVFIESKLKYLGGQMVDGYNLIATIQKKINELKDAAKADFYREKLEQVKGIIEKNRIDHVMNSKG